MISEEEECVTFPLWSLSGCMVGYQTYKPYAEKKGKELIKRRYYTKLTRADGKHVALTAFGLHLLPTSKRKPLFVVEGIFDAAKLHKLGLPCLALLTSSTEYLKSWLWSLGFEIIPICEGDEAGLKLSTLSTSGRSIFLPEGKDLGELSEKETLKFVEKYI